MWFFIGWATATFPFLKEEMETMPLESRGGEGGYLSKENRSGVLRKKKS